MCGEWAIDSWLDWQFKDDYKLGPDGIWYPVDDEDGDKQNDEMYWLEVDRLEEDRKLEDYDG